MNLVSVRIITAVVQRLAQFYERIIERWSDLAMEIARWAFRAGQRGPLPSESTS